MGEKDGEKWRFDIFQKFDFEKYRNLKPLSKRRDSCFELKLPSLLKKRNLLCKFLLKMLLNARI